MLYFLNSLESVWGPFRLFHYITFRAGGAFITAFLFVLFVIPPFLPFFRKHCIQKSPRMDDQPEKPKVPLMGGVFVVAAIVFAALLWGRITDRTFIIFTLSTLALAILGMADDIIKTKYLRSERDGVRERTKVLVQGAVAVVAVYLLYKTSGTVTMQVFFPFSRQPFHFQPGGESIAVMIPFKSTPLCYLPLCLMPGCLIAMLIFNFFVLAGTSNGVNLTDGKDGLAGGCMFIAALAFSVVTYLNGHSVFAEYLGIPYVPQAGEIGIFACAIAGASLGFLWHNSYPASIIMGDTGSLALGGALAMIAIMLGQQLLLPIIGFVFFAETISVWLQRTSYKYRHGKRIFLRAPIHHHFELKGIPDNKITTGFWIVSVLCAIIGLATLKLR